MKWYKSALQATACSEDDRMCCAFQSSDSHTKRVWEQHIPAGKLKALFPRSQSVSLYRSMLLKWKERFNYLQPQHLLRWEQRAPGGSGGWVRRWRAIVCTPGESQTTSLGSAPGGRQLDTGRADPKEKVWACLWKGHKLGWSPPGEEAVKVAFLALAGLLVSPWKGMQHPVCIHWYPCAERYERNRLSLNCVRSHAYWRVCRCVLPVHLGTSCMRKTNGFACGPCVCPHGHTCMSGSLLLAQWVWILVARWTHLYKILASLSRFVFKSEHKCIWVCTALTVHLSGAWWLRQGRLWGCCPGDTCGVGSGGLWVNAPKLGTGRELWLGEGELTARGVKWEWT